MVITHFEMRDKMGRRFSVARIIGIAVVGVLFATGFALLFGWLVMLLWNWLMPDLFGLKTITYWQSFGLTVLAKILFSGVHPPRSHYPRFHKWLRREEGAFSGCGGDDRFSREEWKHYQSFWKEQGEAAFEAYLQKMGAGREGEDRR